MKLKINSEKFIQGYQRMQISFFFYNGHTTKKGRLNLANGEAYDFNYLFQKYGKIGARQLYIFDTCHSGYFSSSSIVPRTATILSSVEAKDAKSERLYMGQKLVEYLRENPHKVEFNREFELRFREKAYAQKPGFHPANTTFYMSSVMHL